MSTPFIVVGTGRSGTSIVAHMLLELGIFMGHRFIPPDENNPLGYFEDKDFSDLNEALFRKDITAEEWETGFQAIVANRERHAPWGWKIPMFLLTFERIVKNLPHATYINCVREHGAVVDSMSRGLDIPTDHAHRTIVAREEMLKRTGIKDKAITVVFEDTLKDPEATVLLLVEAIRGIGGNETTDRERIQRAIDVVGL